MYCSGSVYLDLFPGCVLLRVGISCLVSWVRIAQGRYILTCLLGMYFSGSVYLDLFPGCVLLRVGIS